MIVTIVSFQMPKATTPKDMSDPFKTAVPLFQKIPDLLQKYFYVSDDDRHTDGIYVQASHADTDRLYDGEQRAMIKTKFDGPPTIDFLNSPMMINNHHGTITTPQHQNGVGSTTSPSTRSDPPLHAMHEYEKKIAMTKANRSETQVD